MKLIQFKLVLFVLVSILLMSCSKENDAIYSSEKKQPSVEYSKIELEIFDLVNTHRESLNLKNLKTLNIISTVACSHTDYMIEVGKLSHDNFTKREVELIKKTKAKAVAENVAYGYTTGAEVFKGWLNSKSHRAVIESSNFTHFGISTHKNTKGRNYFTQIFIKC